MSVAPPDVALIAYAPEPAWPGEIGKIRLSFLDEKFEPIGTCSGDRRVGLFLPGHLVPAALLNEFAPRPATCVLEFLKFLFMIGLLHELGDADRRLTRQDR